MTMANGPASQDARNSINHGGKPIGQPAIVSPAGREVTQLKSGATSVGSSAKTEIVRGTIINLPVPVEAFVNPWNWSRLPICLQNSGGVSGAIKIAGGYFNPFQKNEAFRELGRRKRLQPGEAVATNSGKLIEKGIKTIIHVATISLIGGRPKESLIRLAVMNALTLAESKEIRSIAIPLIGAGHGGFDPELAKTIIIDQVSNSQFTGKVFVVEYDGTKLTPFDVLGSTVAVFLWSPVLITKALLHRWRKRAQIA